MLLDMLKDESVDFTDAVIVLPKQRTVTHQSDNPLTAAGAMDWAKAALFADYDDDQPEVEIHPSGVH